MNYEDLEVWLSTHPQLVGVGFEQDISKLKGIINIIIIIAHHNCCLQL